LFYPGVPYLGPIRESRDDEGVVNLSPVEEVESSDRVTEDTDASDVGAGPVGHDGDMSGPIEAVIDVYPEVSEVGYRGDVVRA
jgi:hypothetical protein